MKILLCLLSTLLAAGAAEAKLITKAIPYEHNGVKLEGYIAYDDEKRRPEKPPAS